MQHTTSSDPVNLSETISITQAEVDSLVAQCATLTDQRKARGKRYALMSVLVLTVLAKLAGQTTLRGIAQWCQLRRDPLTALLHLSRPTLPHATTFRRVLGQAVEATAVEQVLHRWMQQQAQTAVVPAHQVLALDGKVLRGTREGVSAQQVRLLSCHLPDQHLTLQQADVPVTTNEIPIAPQVLADVPLAGRVVTGDALHAQRAISQQIVARGGDYCWKVKDDPSRSLVYDALVTCFASPSGPAGTSPVPTDIRSATDTQKGHGRLDVRTIRTSSMLTSYLDWPGMQQVFQIVRTSRDLVRQTVTTKTTYGLTSLAASEAPPAEVLRIVRTHWDIENGLHYRRDVTLGEDRCRVRRGTAPQVLAALNNLVVALGMRQGFATLPDACRYYDVHVKDALQLLLRDCP